MRRSVPLLAAVTCATISTAALAQVPIKATRIAAGLSRPVFVTSAPGDENRLFVVEQFGSGTLSTSGSIKIFDYGSGTLNSSSFLTIPNLSNSGEQGLLGLAFHPDYATNGKFYVNLTNSAGATEIREYTRATANSASTTFTTILSINRPQANHNGGWIGFGPTDGYLYITSGDGGNGDDTGPGHTEGIGNAQDIENNLLGKMLRIDVNSTSPGKNYAIPPSNPFVNKTGDDEIWSYGLRNPFRASHDRQTGDLYIGDVGQGAREEIDFQPVSSPGGENYGWRLREGTIQTPTTGIGGPLAPGMVDPIHEYDHTVGRTVTGGYVYRGSENRLLNGRYFFGDFGTGKIWSLVHNGTTTTQLRSHTGNIAADVGNIGLISSFGEDAQGRLYVVDYAGEIFRLIPATMGDANFDFAINKTDLAALAAHWNQQAGATWADGDFTEDGRVDVADLLELATNWTGSGSLSEALSSYDLPPVSVPEPTALMAIAPLAGILTLRRRR